MSKWKRSEKYMGYQMWQREDDPEKFAFTPINHQTGLATPPAGRPIYEGIVETRKAIQNTLSVKTGCKNKFYNKKKTPA